MKRRLAFGLLLATIGLLLAIGVAGAAIMPAHQAQEENADAKPGHGWLGIVVDDVTTDTEAHFDLTVDSGAVVVKVFADGPGDDADLRSGDVIQGLNGEAVVDADEFVEGIKELSPGDDVTLDVVRGQESLTATATLTDRPRRQALHDRPGRNRVPSHLRGLLHSMLARNVLHAEFEVMGKDGEAIVIAATGGKAKSVTDTTLTIVRRDEQTASFETTEGTRVMVGGHRINLAGLREGTPVLVVEKGGNVMWVLAWPGDFLRHPHAAEQRFHAPGLKIPRAAHADPRALREEVHDLITEMRDELRERIKIEDNGEFKAELRSIGPRLRAEIREELRERLDEIRERREHRRGDGDEHMDE